MPKWAEGTICNDRRSLLYTAGGLRGAVSCLAGPGQSAGGGEAPGSSEKFVFYTTKKSPKCTGGAFFQCLEYNYKKLSDAIDSLI